MKDDVDFTRTLMSIKATVATNEILICIQQKNITDYINTNNGKLRIKPTFILDEKTSIVWQKDLMHL